MNIRTPSLSEIQAVFDVEKDVFGPTVYPAFFFRQALDLWGDLFFVAGDAGRPLDGYVVGAPSNAPGITWVLSLAVREASRRRGIGGGLVLATLDAMTRRGASAARLTVHPASGAVALYRGLGFEIIDEEERYFGAGEPRLVMEVRLPSRARSPVAAS